MKLLVLLLMGVLNSTMVVAQSGADINGSPDALSSLLAAREQAALPANVTQAPKPVNILSPSAGWIIFLTKYMLAYLVSTNNSRCSESRTQFQICVK